MTTDRTIFDPIGRCIYCDATDVELTDEHIIPEGLGGATILPKSSCKICAAITCRAETRLLRGMMWPFRVRMGLIGKRRKGGKSKKIPKTWTANIIGADEKVKQLSVSLDQHPTDLTLPYFGPPGIIEDRQRNDVFENGGWWVCHPDGAKTVRDKVLALGGTGLQSGPLIIDPIVIVLAKIAHAASFALNEFRWYEPLLPDMITGKTPLSSYLVGSMSQGIPPAEPNSKIAVQVQKGYTYTAKDKFLVIRIRFFPAYGSPDYHVVAGRSLGLPGLR